MVNGWAFANKFLSEMSRKMRAWGKHHRTMTYKEPQGSKLLTLLPLWWALSKTWAESQLQKPWGRWTWWLTRLIRALLRHRQDLRISEFKACPVYIITFRPAMATQWDPVLKKKKSNQDQKDHRVFHSGSQVSKLASRVRTDEMENFCHQRSMSDL